MKNELSMYEKQGTGRFYPPFNLKAEGMKHLLLIGFEKDPDEIYGGLEPQLFDDPVHGRGLRVIGWRRDGYVDVYQQPSISTEDKNFDVAGKGLMNLVQRDMEDMKFEITEMGVDIHFSFEDKQGRMIEVSIREKNKKTAKLFDLLAPVGSSSEKPSYLPLFYLYGFYFVRKGNTEIDIKIDGISHRPDSFPFPMDGKRIYFMRYSRDPFLASFNRAYDGELEELVVNEGKAIDSDRTTYMVVDNNGHCEIESMYCEKGSHRVTINFSHPVPDVLSLKDKAAVHGNFIIGAGESTGSIEGIYDIRRNGDEVEIKVHPNGGWKPAPDRFILKLIYRMATVFKIWPKSYIWTARINLGGDNVPMLNSHWERI